MERYYIVHSKNLAIALSYITGEDFYTFDDRFDKYKKVYTFKNYEKAERGFKLLQDVRKDFN